MTQEILLTNSQEEALLNEYCWQGADEMKELGDHLDIEPCPSFSTLEQFASHGSFLQANVYQEDHQDTSLIDNKMSLHQQLAVVDQQQFLQHQQQQQQQQFVPQQQQQQQQQQTLALETPISCREEFPGEYNFQLIVNHKNSSKHWVYSEKLQKIFINMEQVLPLEFSWTPPQEGLWVRAKMVYKYDQHRSQPVVRCHNHMAPDNNSNRNINPRQVEHVIRSTHSASVYEKTQNNHLSVMTPLGTPEAGVTNVPMDFMFFCKNSCTSGMNRRPTEMIFTLETEQNVILGRRKLEVRVCSCPKRDKEKEEGEFAKQEGTSIATPVGKKRKMVNAQLSAPPPGKKVMPDMKVYPVTINVVGKNNLNSVLQYAEDVMLSAGIRANNPDVLNSFKHYADEVSKQRLP